MPLYLTQDKGRRCGVEKAFITPARGRDTLTIYKYAHVSKVFEMWRSSLRIKSSRAINY